MMQIEGGIRIDRSCSGGWSLVSSRGVRRGGELLGPKGPSTSACGPFEGGLRLGLTSTGAGGAGEDSEAFEGGGQSRIWRARWADLAPKAATAHLARSIGTEGWTAGSELQPLWAEPEGCEF
jgi:hypothetical protein